MTERRQLEQAMAHLESQRADLGDAVVDAALAALQAAGQSAPAEQQRKQVTILFADISGFTAMSEALDAEDVLARIDALWRRLDQVVLAGGGWIDKHMGDAVMALWGADVAREDDPERAVRTALALQAELGRLNQDRPAAALDLRVGLHTGPVLLGEVGTQGEYTAMGDAVNLARRLQEMAPVGGVLISHDTYRHVRGLFDVQSLGPLPARGRVEPILAYAVEKARPRSFRQHIRGVEGIATRTIGRAPEIAFLQEAFRRTMADRQGQVVTILGDAGLGKSRLLYELEPWLDAQPGSVRYFRGRAGPEMQRQPYALIRDIVALSFEIQDNDPGPVVQARIVNGLGAGLGPDAAGAARAQVIGRLLGFWGDPDPSRDDLPDPRQLRDRAQAYLGDFFRNTAAAHDTVMLLEDLHWADPSSLDLLDYLGRVSADRPLLLVCSARPSLLAERPGWGQGRDGQHRLELRPLSVEDSRQLVAEILQKVAEIPPALRDLVVERAEGNPFYLEELLKMLIEEGVIVKAAAGWRVELARLDAARIPATLTGVLQARLDGLPPAERTVLQQAAVVGRTFWAGAIARIQEEAGRPAASAAAGPAEVGIAAALAALQGREMIFARASSALAGTAEYTFKHALLHQVTYERVLKRRRRVYHGIVAGWLLEQSGERVAEYPGLVAEHLELAGQVRQAVVYLRQAGEQAAGRFANAEALHYLGRALAQAAEADLAERYALLSIREGVWSLQGEREAQARDLQSLEDLAHQLDDDRRRAEAALRRAAFDEAGGDYAAAVEAAGAVVAWARRCGDAGLEARGSLRWGRALSRQGDYATGRPYFAQALALAQAAGLPNVEADSRRYLGILLYQQGDGAAAQPYFEQALAIKRELGDRQGEGAVLNNLGAVATDLGQYAAARAHFEQALAIRRETGDRKGEAELLNNLGALVDNQGDYTAARAFFEEALRIKHEIGDQPGVSATLNNLGAICDSYGDYGHARTCWEQALAIKRAIGDRRGEEMVLCNLALLARHLAEHEAAQAYCREALQIAREIGDRRIQVYAWMHLGYALAGRGQLDEAEAAYRQALDLFQEWGRRAAAVDVLAGLAQVELARGARLPALALVEEILGYVEQGTPEMSEDIFYLYLSCYRVLAAQDDPRGPAVLRTAQALLRERAGRIADVAVRRLFLEGVATHRELLGEEGRGPSANRTEHEYTNLHNRLV